MNLVSLRAASGTHVIFGPTIDGAYDKKLHLLVCEEKSCVSTAQGISAIWFSIFGTAEISIGTRTLRLRKGDIYITDGQPAPEVSTGTRGVCIGIGGLNQTWAALNNVRGAAAIPIPALYRNELTSCRKLFHLARHQILERSTLSLAQFGRVLTEQIEDLQSSLIQLMSRCPGSSIARRRSVLVRLQRARNLIEISAHEDLDIAQLALAANYSVGHFISIFRAVYGETPYASISRHRMQTASTLLTESKLAVGEIAQSTGFPSPSSFSRAIKRHLGQSASAFRATSSATFGTRASRDECSSL